MAASITPSRMSAAAVSFLKDDRPSISMKICEPVFAN
jgi:hypothetical protein